MGGLDGVKGLGVKGSEGTVFGGERERRVGVVEVKEECDRVE